jgi:hypothetical protein
MFKIKGLIAGKEYTIKYKNEKLSGDQYAIDVANNENKLNHGYLGPVPGGEEKEYLSSEVSAYYLICNFVFEEIIAEQKNWGKLPEGENVVY